MKRAFGQRVVKGSGDVSETRERIALTARQSMQSKMQNEMTYNQGLQDI